MTPLIVVFVIFVPLNQATRPQLIKFQQFKPSYSSGYEGMRI